MALPSSGTPSLVQAFGVLMSQAAQIKDGAQNTIAVLAAGPVNTGQIFSILDQLRGVLGSLNQYKNMAGLNVYVTAEVPGYAGTATDDIAVLVNAVQGSIDWVVANFPKDNTNTWILAYQLSADGSRVQRTFTTPQTAGLRTQLQNIVNAIA